MKRAVFVTAALASFACSEGGDYFVVVIDSDFLVPRELAVIEVETRAEGQTTGDGASFDPVEDGLPLSFGVEPPDGGRLLIDVRALDGTGAEVMHRLAIVEGTVGPITRVPIFLASQCASLTCDTNETCTEQGCSRAEIGTDVLRGVEEGRESQDMCRPGEGRCTNNGTGFERCEHYGGQNVSGDCPVNEVCDPNNFTCTPNSTGGDMVRVEVLKVGSGAGYVSSRDGSIDCGARCFVDVPRGTSIVIDASPDGASSFITWEGACSGLGPCTLKADSARTVTARFDAIGGGVDEELVVDLVGSGGGRITSTPPGIDCTTGTCRAHFPRGTDVALQTTPQTNAAFGGWTGECSGLAPCSVRMDGPRWVSGNFVYDDGSANVNLSVVFGGDGVGRVTSLPAAIDCGSMCNATFPRGAQVRLQATPEPDNHFSHWEGACGGSSDCTIDLTTNLEAIAIFTTNTPRFVPMDVNADGFPDLVVGAPGTTAGTQADAGKVYVVFGPRAQTTMMATTADRVFDGPQMGARLGSSVAVGDFDGDGFDDIAMGAPGHQGRGAVFLIFGGPGLIGSTNVGSGGGPIIVGENNGDRFGASLWVEDLDANGFDDLLVGAPSNGPSGVGKAYLFEGRAGFAPTVTSYFARFDSSAIGDEFGASVAIVGDINRDGWWDVAVGAPKWSPTTESQGRVSVFFGRSNATPNTVVTTPDFTIDGVGAMDVIGWSIAPIADFNLDGIDDIALGSPFNDRVHVHFGRTSWPTGATPASLLLSGIGWFGASVTGGHDVTGDFVPDLVVGAPFWEGNKGAVEVFAGSAVPSSTPSRRLEGRCVDSLQCNHEFFGFTVDTRSDIDGNGTADLFVGSRFGGGPAGSDERGRVSTFDLPSYTAPGPIRSVDADVHLIGEDQPFAWCAAVPGSRVYQ